MPSDAKTKEPISLALAFTITQAICISLILLSLIAIKYLFKPTYKELEKWYRNNMLSDTAVSEVLDFEI